MSLLTGAILLFQHLYVENYPFNYKPCIQWVVKHGELRMAKVTRRRKFCHQLIDLIPLFVCFTSFAIMVCSIFLLSRIENLVLWKSSRFWGWLVFATASGLFGFVCNMIGIGKKRDSVLHLCNAGVDLAEKIRTGTF